MEKKEFLLEGLNCANCATKIEENVKKLEGVNEANINFVNKTLTLKISSEIKPEEIEKIVKKVEPDVKIYDKNIPKNKSQNEIEQKNNASKEYEDEDEVDKAEIRRLLFSLTFFILALLIKEPFALKLSLFIVSYLVSGWKVLFRSFKNILNGTIFDETFLMSIATIGAFTIGEFPEAVGVMLFYEFGDFLQDKAVDNSRKSIKSLLNMRPTYANLLKGDKVLKVSPEEVKVGHLLLINPGEKVPLDGIVVKGISTVDTSALTGESVPKRVKENDEVLSGFINLNGTITIRVQNEYSESTFSKILDIVENASNKKAKTEKFITKFAKYYTPVIVFSAIALAFIPPLIVGGAFSQWLYRALIFLVISCPCALVISIPLIYFAGIGKLSKKGVLVKGGNYLETLKNVDTIIFDKTGTLTKGLFEVSEIKPLNGLNEEALLKIAAYAESHSNHPIAKSIKEYFHHEIDENLIKEHEEIAGKGVISKINNDDILIGNKELLEKYGIEVPSFDSYETIVYIAINKNLAGYIKISDKIKPMAKETIKELKKLGIKKTVLLTGDNEKIGRNIALNLEIDEYYAKLLPEDKVKLLEKYLKEKPSVAFIGDGINDAPVLARADVGIAMGGLGSDAAIEASDIVIMDDDLSKLIDLINVSKKTARISWQNLSFILTIKFLFLILGALGLTNMWGAVFADVGVTLLTIFNSLRILR
ncbi:heavy metal translocating P-type ATPase [Petrotoga sp. 9PWA.NaAc.5.4]|uniref:heavy metal translocating P-type ATPase n=1 Tax=Petrotoga sp. 9PWA.NaAc.5.4 TaxID=1434328 RepID=UPI000CBA0507|nr:heavy metal translocating P-type ATPase [Petrotoga sp. 9PWA.NaAc.5.4]PNR96686.1 ATPase [Petrotoga sp. 9PWA.NaAc.5.4]